MWTMSDEEVAAKNKQVADLYASDDLEDKICGLLMDINVGRTGLHEGTAKTKAAAIVELIEKGLILRAVSNQP